MYEYKTEKFDRHHDESYSLFHKRMAAHEQDGWVRIWADVNLDGAFAVYRREAA